MTDEAVLARMVAILAGKIHQDDPERAYAACLLFYAPEDLVEELPEVATEIALDVARRSLTDLPTPQGVPDPPEPQKPLEGNLASLTADLAFTDGIAGRGGFARELITRARQGANAMARLAARKGGWRAALTKEAANFLSHRRAQKAREQKLGVIDDAVARWGTLLSWRAVLDEGTTAECREAHGKNFSVTDPPAIGFPGLVHINCRCVPGPPTYSGERI